MGTSTVANAHFELLIPGTTQHEVLNWELAEKLVTVDFARSGLLTAPPAATGAINPAPFRGINPLVYNGLPAGLRQLIGGPAGNVAAPVPLATDGKATILAVADPGPGSRTVSVRTIAVPFNQVISKPFCASGPFDYLYVTGTIDFRQQVVVTPSGHYLSHFLAKGELELTPVNPLTSPPTPIGETFRARVVARYDNIVTDHVTRVSNLQMQVMIPPTGPFRGSLHTQLEIGPGGSTHASFETRCGS